MSVSIKLIFLCCLTLAALVALVVFPSQPAKGITGLEKYKEEVRSGLGEIDPPVTAEPEAINASAKKLAGFIQHRSGVAISEENLETLKTLEYLSRQKNGGISSSDLSRKLSEIAIARLPMLNDDEIEYIAENLRGFYAPDLPVGFKKGRSHVRLRSDGRGRMELEWFKTELKTLRDSGIDPLTKYLMAHQIESEISGKVRFLAETSPMYFGNVETHMTPMQAIIIVYSVSADDPLACNKTGMEKKMKTVEDALSRYNGVPYPVSSGHRAYGENGFLSSSPVKLLLDDATVAEILSLFNGSS